MTEAGSSSTDRADVRLRILLFSDLCLDRPYPWATAAAAESRRAAQREALVEILTAARNYSVDAIACAGDLFDRYTVTPAHIEWLIAAFRSVGVPRILIAPGNHDFVGPIGGYTRHDWPDNVIIFDTDQLTPVSLREDVTIWGAAHTEAHRLRSFLEGSAVDRPGVNLALFHGTELAGQEREPDLYSAPAFLEADIERAGFDHALVGHYQRPHFGTLHTYPGAPLAHDFRSGPGGGSVLVTLHQDGSLERNYLRTTVPPLYDLEVDLTDAQSQQQVIDRAIASIAGRTGVIRLHFAGHLSPGLILRYQDFVDQLGPIGHVLIEPEPGVDVELGQIGEEPTIRGQYVRDVVESTELSKAQQQRVLLIGLRALAGHDQLEGLA